MSDKGIQVRRANLADLETIVAFNRAMAAETEDRDLDLQTVRAGVRQGLEDPIRSQYYVAEIESAIVGQTMVTLEWSDWRNGFFWWIQSVYVEPGFRGQGVFKGLHEHIRTAARQQGNVCGLRLYVHNENERAIEIYHKLGMAVTDYYLCEEDWSSPDDGST